MFLNCRSGFTTAVAESILLEADVSRKKPKGSKAEEVANHLELKVVND